MRFQVGQIVIGYRFIIEMADGRVIKTCSNLFRHGSRSIKFDPIILECVEHHRVPINDVDDTEADGAEYDRLSAERERVFLSNSKRTVTLTELLAAISMRGLLR